ncbi:MAG: AI-2E family transporter [Nanoarchaeota archaeon]|nr:AI-2E family transporter [Nanoarchaeota archaeon]
MADAEDLFKKFVPTLVLICFGVLCFLIIKPFLSLIVTSILIAYIFSPIHNLINKKISGKAWSSLIMCIIVTLTVTLPFILLTNPVVTKAPKLISSITSDINISKIQLDSFNDIMHENYGFMIDFSTAINALFTWLADGVQKVVLSVPTLIFNAIIILIFLYYIFKDGKELSILLKLIVPIKKENKKAFIDKIRKITDGIIYGHIIASFVQAIVATIGFLIFGVKGAFLLGFLTLFVAIIPMFGTPLIFAPVGLWMIFTGVKSGNFSLTGKGIGLIIYGFAVVTTIDNFIKPKIISDQADIHPVVIIIGVFGGLALFGFIGLIIGPLIFSIFTELLKEYRSS